jgi:PKD repeat protein
VIDLDGNQNSSQAMMEALANMEVVAEYANAFPDDLNLYSNIFVCLGIYSENTVLSSGDGQLLADYLNNGGNLYMEGGDTWYFDTQTAVHSMFSINATNDGGADLSTVNGQPGTFTEGFSFTYSGDNNYIDHIEPVGSAIKIFENQNPVFGTAIINDAGTYKTIASSHEFGGLDDGESTKEELMVAYLEFFGLSNVLSAMFSSNVTEICEGEIVEFYDMSTGDIVEWEWIFEGGTPGSSTIQNPSVMYNTAGIYDVTLIITDGVDSHSVTFEDYIVVNVCTGIEEKNIEKISVYPNPNFGIFTVELNNVPGDFVSVKVLNSLNKVVFKKHNIRLNNHTKLDMDLSNLNKGLYFLVFENYRGSAVQRIIIR